MESVANPVSSAGQNQGQGRQVPIILSTLKPQVLTPPLFPICPQIPAIHVRELHPIDQGDLQGGPDPHAVHLHVVPPVNRSPPREHGNPLVFWHRGDRTARRASLPRNLHGGGTRIGGCTADMAVDSCQAPHPCGSPVSSVIHLLSIAIVSVIHFEFSTISTGLFPLE
jgi:hypothetical protein